MKVGVNLGLTICVDSESRNYAKFGFSIDEIDTNADIEAQAVESVGAILEVYNIANKGLEEAVTTALTDLSVTNPGGLRDELGKMNENILYIQEKLIPNIVSEVKRQRESLDKMNDETSD